jgi:hypothetical protein
MGTVAHASSAPGRQVKRTAGFIESLAISGPLLAYDVQGGSLGGPACNRVYAWSLGSGRVTKMSGRGTCGADDTSTGAGVVQLAVAGSRLAWIVNTGGNTESNDRLFTAAIPRPSERRLAATTRTGNIDCVLTGKALGGLVGSGGVLAYNIWTTVAANPDDESSCATKSTAGSLRRIEARGTTLLRSGVDTLVARDADAGRIAVLHDDGTLELFSSNGTPLRTIGIVPAKEIALSGDRLVVLTKTRSIQIYSAKTGRPGAAYAVPRVAGDLEAAGAIAAYASGTKLHVLRFATRKDTVVATAPKQIVDVALSSTAVAYAYNVTQRLRRPPHFRDVGNVVVMPIR